MNFVSIHPMCRFKIYFFNAINGNCKVSIHPMCRFKQQNILKAMTLLCFNTSYVSVQAAVFGAKSSEIEVSIHPMCRFKKTG